MNKEPFLNEDPTVKEQTDNSKCRGSNGFQQFKFNTLSPFLYRNPGKKNPPLS